MHTLTRLRCRDGNVVESHHITGVPSDGERAFEEQHVSQYD